MSQFNKKNNRLEKNSTKKRRWRFALLVGSGIGLPLLLAGCSGMNAQFGCDAMATSQCTAVSRVNAQAEAGYFDSAWTSDVPDGSLQPGKRDNPEKNKTNNEKRDSKKNGEKAANAVSNSSRSVNARSPKQRKRIADFQRFRWMPALKSSPMTTSSTYPLRSPERIQRIWIAPFEDRNHHYHSESEVFVVLEPAHWVNTLSSQKQVSLYQRTGKHPKI